MLGVLGWIAANWQLLVGILMALLSAASLVTKLTPSPKDDEWVRRIIAWLSFLQPADSPGATKLPLTSPRRPDEPLITRMDR